MAKNKLTRILTSPDREIRNTHGANGALARLFRVILLDLNIGPSRFGSLLQDYILDPRNGVANNKQDQTSARGNLTKEFARPQMTWKVFCKALKFLQILRIEFSVTAHWRHGNPTVHSTKVNLGGIQITDIVEEEAPVTSLANTEFEIDYLDIDHKTGQIIKHDDSNKKENE